MNKLFKPIVIISLLLLFFSCEKKIVEIIPVMVVEKNMSIPGASDIKYFSFPSATIGYAASKSSFIYKTTNGGTSWTTITVASTKTCRGLEFFDENKGMCLMNNDVYVTSDGGQTWSIRGSGDFIGISENGKGILGEETISTFIVKTSSNYGQTFQSLGNVTIDGSYTTARVVDNKIIVFSSEVYYNDVVNGLDITNGNNLTIGFGNIIAEENPRDIYLSGEAATGTVVGNDGLIMGNLFVYLGPTRTYYQHTYPYYSVDGFGGLVVGVGEKTITTNLDIDNGEKWNYVLDVNGNGFPNTFYKIRFISQNTFYISGSNGLIFKASI